MKKKRELILGFLSIIKITCINSRDLNCFFKVWIWLYFEKNCYEKAFLYKKFKQAFCKLRNYSGLPILVYTMKRWITAFPEPLSAWTRKSWLLHLGFAWNMNHKTSCRRLRNKSLCTESSPVASPGCVTLHASLSPCSAALWTLPFAFSLQCVVCTVGSMLGNTLVPGVERREGAATGLEPALNDRAYTSSQDFWRPLANALCYKTLGSSHSWCCPGRSAAGLVALQGGPLSPHLLEFTPLGSSVYTVKRSGLTLRGSAEVIDVPTQSRI